MTLNNPDNVDGHVGDIEEALRVVACDEAHVSAPAYLEDAVMRAWDAAHAEGTSRSSSRASSLRVWLLAASAAMLFVGVSVWRGILSEGELLTGKESEGLATPDSPGVWSDAVVGDLGLVLEADPTSVRIVKLRVSRSNLAMFGFPVVEPDARGTVELDVVIGQDGVARGIAGATSVEPFQD